MANDGDAGEALDDAKRVGEGVGLDPTRRPVAKPQRRRPRGHVGSYEASALFFDPLRRTERAHCRGPPSIFRLSVQLRAVVCDSYVMRSKEQSDTPPVSSRQQCCVIHL